MTAGALPRLWVIPSELLFFRTGVCPEMSQPSGDLRQRAARCP